jgi:hypothetical protein
MAAEMKQAGGAFTLGVKKSILGAKVVSSNQEEMGKIEDIVLDASDYRVAYAVLSLGGFLGFGDEHFAIPWEALSFDVSERTAVLSGRGASQERAALPQGQVA